MKITPRVREQAAIYCSMVANWFHAPIGAVHPTRGDVILAAERIACRLVNEISSSNLTNIPWAQI